mmetsp:Transcript_19803/g.37795  ORF Transcript_19803/g.37795 Transcript_19803/m.37795 type:complete len:248 (+) Transcript_19803:112-855(+)|eukprot:CAMPEP_0114240216 /NCGR_PEP_ID=MMETSP0058-20121206/8928_1 /TAXON_ID=36894 /ORGANISM="Pyramimonas parkeae, CCMP726" /LENGTH=247 /DNA_ID=CAMNT_0001352555 /DNA_START=88 /DNA_END=831 /DNA_ORIENTATION=-
MSAMACSTSSFMLSRTVVSARQQNRIKAAKVVCQSSDGASAPTKSRKPSPLETGGTLQGSKAAGKDAGAAALSQLKGKPVDMGTTATTFDDSRWVEGCWDFDQFKGADGEVDWNEVVDAEVRRRKILELFPAACDDKVPVTFDLSMIPWKVWVTRFHLPEAEQINGRAAMIGLVSAYMVDAIFHVSIVDQFDSFVGKLFLAATLGACLFIRRNEDYDNLKGLADEATFYDRQWQATWDGVERPSERE